MALEQGRAAIDICGLPRPELGELLERLGAGRALAKCVFRAVHARPPRDLASDPGVGWRNAGIIERATRRPGVRIAEQHDAGDGAEKLVFQLRDGERVEGVLLPAGDRASLCVSTQVGCAMGCAFCSTGQLGLTRALEPGEIVDQVRLGRLRARELGLRLRSVVLMGMGEPLHDYEATRRALEVLSDTVGPSFPPSRIRLSTVGLVPRIRQLACDLAGRVQLALSLNAGTDATRRRLIPAARRYDLQALHDACAAYPLPSNRWLMIEYVLLPGVNDSEDELAGVAAWTRGLRCVINLIPFNPFPGAPFAAPTPERIVYVHHRLRELGALVKVRRPRGRAVDAACGQLAGQTVG